MAILRDNTGLESIVFFAPTLLTSLVPPHAGFHGLPLAHYPRTAVRLGLHTRGSGFPVDVYTRIRNTVVHFLPGIVKSGFVAQNAWKRVWLHNAERFRGSLGFPLYAIYTGPGNGVFLKSSTNYRPIDQGPWGRHPPRIILHNDSRRAHRALLVSTTLLVSTLNYPACKVSGPRSF